MPVVVAPSDSAVASERLAGDEGIAPATGMNRVAVVPQPFTLGLRLLRVRNAPAHLLLVLSCIALAGFLHRSLADFLQICGSRKYPQIFGMVPSAKLL
jgi:hypothetical protein